MDSPTQTFSELEPTSLDDTPGSWDFLLGDELPDVECTELQDENEDEEDMELNSETALASFAEFLVDAQAAAQKAERQLEQLVESRGHICDFYPKYHCELNFIEMYWGAAKFKYRKSPSTKNIEEMEANVKRCLDEVPQLFILWFSNRAAPFVSAYYLGCTGKDLGYLQKTCKSHRMLPYDAVILIKQSVHM